MEENSSESKSSVFQEFVNETIIGVFNRRPILPLLWCFLSLARDFVATDPTEKKKLTSKVICIFGILVRDLMERKQ